MFLPVCLPVAHYSNTNNRVFSCQETTSYRGPSNTMSTSLRIGDIVKTYSGDGDVTVWLKKLKLVVKMQKVGDLHTVIPLFLDGDAFAVYDQMDEASKGDAGEIERVLLNAFAMSNFQAYDALRQRCWRDGEQVDVYLADLRRLAGLAEIRDENALRCAFVVGLPSDVSSQLRSSSRIHKMDVSAIVEQARALMSDRSHAAVFVAARGKPGMLCNRCGRSGHIAKSCWQTDATKRADQQASSSRGIICFRCNGPGHIARNCRVDASGNAKGESHSPAASPSQQ